MAKAKPVVTASPATGFSSQEVGAGAIAVATDTMDSPDLSGNDSGEEVPDDQLSPNEGAERSFVKAEDADEDSNAANETLHMPVQKRRRVTRACDECRRKKIKCDGKQPCTHCSVYSYECTYDKPSNRRRNPAPQYIEALESKLQRAEALLRKFIPDFDLNDPNLDPAIQQEFQNRESARLQAAKLKKEEVQVAQEAQEAENTQIQSMIKTIGQLDLTENGGWDFRGISSGAVFLRRMKDHFKGRLGYDYTTTFLPRPSHIPGLFSLDSPRSNPGSSPSDSTLPNVHDLPPKEKARKLSYNALNCATCLLRIVHLPSFYESFDRLYEKSVENFDAEDNRFLGLLYSVMAVGCMYNIAEQDLARQLTYNESAEEGMRYYTAARVLLQDVTECRELTSLQTLLFTILFLQATSNLSACYSFLGVALRTALRMGLHRNLVNVKFTPLIIESRRRVFYWIRQMDTYVSALLGFPILLKNEDIDQKLPNEVDDEFITNDGILTPPPDSSGSVFQAYNAHAKLMDILGKVIKHIYPLQDIKACASNTEDNSNATYMISYARIKEIENDLQEWHEQLPPKWRPCSGGPIETFRIRTLLRFGYAHCQMMLYRPFLHYVSPRLSSGKSIDERYYACGAAGISVSRNIIHIAMEIRDQSLVVGPFWSILYTQFFAILSLIFYVLENPDKQGSIEIYADANAGREMIASMAGRSLAADRITQSLNNLWDNLPEQLKKGSTRPIPTKKRSAPGPKEGSASTPSTITLKPSQGRGPDETNQQQQTRQMGHVAHRASFESRRPSSQSTFVSTFPEIHALDMSPTETSSNPGHSGQYARHNSQTESPSASHLYKLDAMMFPSGDPFAYPSQPLLEFGAPPHHENTQPHHINTDHTQDVGNFYMPQLYGNIEGQIMGPMPPYLMQSPHGYSGLDLSAQMYPPQGMSMQQAQAQHHAQQQRNHRGGDIDEMMADAGFNKGNWGDMFGNSFRPL